MPEAPDREAEELAVVGDAEEALGDRQGDQLGVGLLKQARVNYESST